MSYVGYVEQCFFEENPYHIYSLSKSLSLLTHSKSNKVYKPAAINSINTKDVFDTISTAILNHKRFPVVTNYTETFNEFLKRTFIIVDERILFKAYLGNKLTFKCIRDLFIYLSDIFQKCLYYINFRLIKK